jgi:hypothetical protein
MTRPNPFPYRQGHILLGREESLPANAVPVPHPPGYVVIATGETGREHCFKSERVEIFQQDGLLFIEVRGDEPVELSHPEHGVIEVDPGIWKVIEQREEQEQDQPRRSYPD